MSGTALSDLTVIECAQGVAGPFCGKALADFGADVIKVEPPEGDRSRRHGPFRDGLPHPERSGQFLYLNANKRGITLDLETADDRHVLEELARTADVLLIDLPPRRLESLELTYDRLRPLNPRLIMTVISPFGLTGPYRDFKATDLTLFHIGGMGRETPFNEITDLEAFPPLKAGGYQAEYITGWTAAATTMVAVAHRAVYGEGQLVDLGAMEAVTNMLRFSVASYTYNPDVPATRLKTGFPWVLPCKDGHVSFSPFNNNHWWQSFKEMMGDPEWARSEVFDTPAGRSANADVIEPLAVEWLLQHTKREIYEMALDRQIACFPVNSPADVLRSRQFAFRRFFQDVEHPEAGTIRQPGPAIRFQGTPWRIARPAPRLGEHAREVGREPSVVSSGHRVERSSVQHSNPSTDGLRPTTRSPLAGIRVADFGWVLAVPHATAWLAILGADVIRVESLARPDIVRAAGLTRGADGISGINRGGFYNGLNFNKKSITLNLAHPRGLELAKELISCSDVVTENFAAGVFEKLGLGYEVVRRLKPDVIMLSGSPLGANGPDRMATGWGPNTQAYAGLPYITGYEGGPPSGIGGLYPDYMIGVVMAFALLTALHHRARTGEGQFIEVAMAETVATMIPEALLEYTLNGRERPRMGNYDDTMAPHGVYRCAGEDKWVAIAVAGDDEWRALRKAMGEPDWARDPKLERVTGRRRHREELDRGIGDWTRWRTHYEVMHLLQAAGVAAGPCLDVPELLADPQLAERRLLVEVDHPEVGRRVVVGLPGRFSAVPAWDIRPAPCLGEHNQSVYTEILGLTRNEVARLIEEKVIY